MTIVTWPTGRIGSRDVKRASSAKRIGRDSCVQIRVEKDVDFVDDSLSEEHDVYRVRGLANCDAVLERLQDSHRHRVNRENCHEQTAAGAHLAEHGHELAFGCCRVETLSSSGDSTGP